MAQKYDWGDGKGPVHNIPLSQHQSDQQAGSYSGNGWNPQWLLDNAPAGTGIQLGNGATGLATGPPATGTTAQPYDPSTDEAAITGGRNVALGNADAAWQTGNIAFDSGYNADGTVNTSNPYSRAALYQLAHDNTARANSNSGPIFSGAANNAVSLNDQALARNDAANRLAASRAVHGVQTGQLTTAANAGTAVSGTDFNALLKATYPTSS